LIFAQGFLHFFGLANDPVEDIRHRMQQKSDAERLLGDWCKVGTDIRNAYEAAKK
jgi:hypothetical protein